MSDLVEGIKLLGGIAGLGTAAFTIYDRLVKSRPIVSLMAAADRYDGVGDLYLRVVNRSDREIVITGIRSNPDLSVRLHDDTESIIEGELGYEAARLVAPDETVFIQVFLDDELRETLPASVLELRFSVDWHRAAGPTWLKGLPLRATIRGDDLARVLKDAARRNVRSPTAPLSPRDL